MSYLVLARKWRPQDFDQVVGQGPIVKILRNALRRQRVPHAMLFSGVRGVGKTTLARIMAKALNCSGPENERPCNSCDSCREITAGNAIDLHEIDGASNRGIQEIRDLKENIRFLPSKSRYKIIIIDEVHMLTAEAFNALLKTLEEPPAHVLFMFATTEPHKIPVTILSRCQRYELKRVPFRELQDHFTRIAAAEGVEISPAALEMIVREAAGSVRDGLSLLDQVFSFGDARMTDEDVREVLGLVDRQVYTRLARALLAGEVGPALEILDQVCAAGADLKRFLADLLYFVRSLVIARVVKEPAPLLDVSDRELAELSELAGSHQAETLYRLLEQLMRGSAEMQYAPQPRLALEMILARAVQAGEVVPVTRLLARLDDLLRTGTGPQQGTEPGEGIAAAMPLPVAPAEVLTPPADSEAETSMPKKPVESKEARPEAGAVPTAEPPAEYIGGSLPQGAAANEAGRDVRRDWPEFIEYVKERKKWLAPILKMCVRVREQDHELQLRYENISDAVVLQEPDNHKILTEFAQDFFQRELTVRIMGHEGAADGKGVDGSPQEERRVLANDPLVQMTADIFGGQVVNVRTGPRSRVGQNETGEES
jgi:DNA polymerase-3 subunit gamma/tau